MYRWVAMRMYAAADILKRSACSLTCSSQDSGHRIWNVTILSLSAICRSVACVVMCPFACIQATDVLRIFYREDVVSET
jgi:hypothetical protein